MADETQTSIPLLIVPGTGNSGPDHWQSHWERAYDRARRMTQDDWSNPFCADWIEAFDHALAYFSEPVLLIGHSAGTMTIIHWAAHHERPIHGALLVAPTDFESEIEGFPSPDIMADAGWAPIPRQRLPFPSIVVASTNDPFVRIDRAEEFARAWGSRFINIGAKGHINADAGFGPWPEGEQLLKKLLSMQRQ
jgi:predicted alpha/beta hydrolase family esterase